MLISKSKQNHFSAFFQENLKSSKKLWNKNNELINKKQKRIDDLFLCKNGVIITKQKKVANKFNKYFINFAQNLLKDLGESNSKIQDYLKDPNENSFFLKEIEPGEMYKLHQKLNINKRSDIYVISPKVISYSNLTLFNIKKNSKSVSDANRIYTGND